MQKIEFRIEKEMKLSKAISNELPNLSRLDIKKIIENKDVKVNKIRVKQDELISAHSNIVVYYQTKESKEWYSVVYYDDNIVIVNKRAGIEVVSEDDRDLLAIIRQEFNTAIAVHRIDRNTEGLVIFALNKTAEKELLAAFKTRTGIIKKYALKVHGRVDITKIKRTVYLKKVASLSKVWISEIKTTGYDPIITEFDVIQYDGDDTLLEAKLLTGKTHQIRAHIAYYGHPIIGDQKYGKDDNKVMCLTSNYLGFNFGAKSNLKYLNKKNFEIIPSWL